jgi:hypothetical protein
MDHYLDERHYAWRLIRAVRHDARDEIAALLEAAMDAGLDRNTLIIELAELGGRLLTLCDPVSTDVVA